MREEGKKCAVKNGSKSTRAGQGIRDKFTEKTSCSCISAVVRHSPCSAGVPLTYGAATVDFVIKK